MPIKECMKRILLSLSAILKKEFLWILLAIVILAYTSFGLIIQNYARTPPDHYYIGGADYPIDMIGILAIIREGYLGHWNTTIKISSMMPSTPLFVKMEYILMGQAGRMLHLDPLVMYHLTKIATFTFLILVTYFLISKTFRLARERILAFWFTIFATGMIVSGNERMAVIAGSIPKDMLPNARLTLASHHYLLGCAFALLSMYLLAKYFEGKQRFLSLAAAIFCGMLVSYLYFPIIVLVLGATAFYVCVCLVRNNCGISFGSRMKKVFVSVVYAIGVLLPAVYIYFYSQFLTITNFKNLEQLVPFDTNPRHYLILVGAVYLFAVIGAIRVFRKHLMFPSLLAGWVIVHPIALYVLAPLFGFNSVRFLFTPYFIVFAILSVYGIIQIIELFKRQSLWVSGLITVLCTALIVLPGWQLIRWGIKHYHVCYCMVDDSEFGYPRRTDMEALWWLRDNTHEEDIVLSSPYVGNLIPAFAGNWIYVSWWYRLIEPPNVWETFSLVNAFYTEQLSDDATYSFLSSNAIRYIYFRPDEWQGLKTLQYPFLVVRYQNPEVIIYEVNK